MEDPGRAAIGDLKLRVGDAGLLVAITAICANESHVFIVDDRDGDVELIDPVYNELDIWPSHVAKLDPLPDLDVEAVGLLTEKGAGKQRADDDGQENLFHGLVLAEREARGNVETRGRVPISLLPSHLLSNGELLTVFPAKKLATYPLSALDCVEKWKAS